MAKEVHSWTSSLERLSVCSAIEATNYSVCTLTLNHLKIILQTYVTNDMYKDDHVKACVLLSGGVESETQ